MNVIKNITAFQGGYVFCMKFQKYTKVLCFLVDNLCVTIKNGFLIAMRNERRLVMRIEAYNQINQVYSARKPMQASKVNNVSRTDQVQISSFGKDLQTLKQAVANAPDVRANITEPIKASINGGTYEVNNNDFAGKLMEKYGMR